SYADSLELLVYSLLSPSIVNGYVAACTICRPACRCLFFFHDAATTDIYTLSLHDALPICPHQRRGSGDLRPCPHQRRPRNLAGRSEEHTSELQSHLNLVCRLLLEKKKKGDHELFEVAGERDLHLERTISSCACMKCAVVIT